MSQFVRTAVTVVVVAMLVAVVPSVVSRGGATAHPSVPVLAPRSSGAPAVPATVSRGSSPRSPLSEVQWILTTLRDDGVPARDIHLPNLAAAGPHPNRQVGILYGSAPAPMGISDIGLENVSGNLVPYVIDTTSAAGTITVTNAQSMYVDGDGPDMYGVQLNSALTNVTLFGNSTYQFWAQNFLTYTSSSGELSFGDSLWNFSALPISPNVLYANGPNGSLVAPIFYYAVGPTFTVRYPFTVSFYLNSTTLEDRPALFFNYSLSSTTVNAAGSFDYVVFNSSATVPHARAPTAQFQVNGEAYNPIGLVNDIELVVVGNDAGDTTTFYQMNATLSIAYWNDSRARYDTVPSAFNSGTDTGETSNGVQVYYNASAGVGEPVAHMIVGPSFLNGLWNVSSTAGVRLFQVTQTPVNAFLFISPGTSFNETTAQWVPTIPFALATSNFGIPNDGNPYYFEWMLSDYHATGASFNTAPNSTDALTETLVRGMGVGLYTPLLAWGNSELPSISRSGAGTPASPYVIESNQRAPLDPVFSQWNDFQFPVFAGLLLVNTTAWVTVTPPTFQIVYPPGFVEQPAVTAVAPGLPGSNDLQLEFDNVSNVTIKDGPSISGWFSWNLPNVYPLGAVIFWNSSGNLIAGNTFYDQGSSIALYGGTNNTVWGNSFLNTSVAATNLSAVFQQQPLNVTAVYESESGDLIYNNYFDVATPAFTPTSDPLLCQIECEPSSYVDRWNVSLEPANATATFLRSSLTGSIIGTWYQGGNFWSNYGTQADPFGILPYNDSGLITNGGDYVPLVPNTLFPVTFRETGLGSGTPWSVTTLGVTTSSGGASLVLWAPNGTYNYSLPSPAGYEGPDNGSFTVNNASASVSVLFAPLEPVTFSETGLILGSTWSVRVPESNGSNLASGTATTSTLVLELAGGTSPVAYSGLATAFGYLLVTWSTEVGTSPVEVSIVFTPAMDLEFLEGGLTPGTPWTVTLQKGAWSTDVTSLNTTILFTTLNTPTGLLNYTVAAAGYVADPASGAIVTPASPAVGVEFTPINGTLLAHVSPAGATLAVGGQPVPVVDGSASVSLTPGLYSVKVTESGYLPYFNNISVSSARTSELNVSLTSMPTAPAPGISTAAWALIGILAAVTVLLLLVLLVSRSRGRRPPATPIAAVTAPSVPPATPPSETGPSVPWKEQ